MYSLQHRQTTAHGHLMVTVEVSRHVGGTYMVRSTSGQHLLAREYGIPSRRDAFSVARAYSREKAPSRMPSPAEGGALA